MPSRESSWVRRTAGFAAHHHWVISRAELVGLGMPLSTIDSWLESGRLVPLLHAVYGYGRDIESSESAWRAALLAAGPGAALAGRTACEFWGMVQKRKGIPARIRIASGRNSAGTLKGRSRSLARTRVELIHRQLDPAETCQRNGFTVTTPARAQIDFAAEASPAAVRFAFLEACRLGHLGRTEIEYCFRRIAGRRGATSLRPHLALWVPELQRINSVLEGLFLLAWIPHDHRRPLVNEKVLGYEVDCYWPSHRLVFELDGRAYHANPAARARDAVKDRRLRAGGLTVIRFGYEAVNEDPGTVLRTGSRLLDAAEASGWFPAPSLGPKPAKSRTIPDLPGLVGKKDSGPGRIHPEHLLPGERL